MKGRRLRAAAAAVLGALGAPYESHITTSDGRQLEVQVSEDFAVVASDKRAAHP